LARKILLADDSVTAQNMGRKILADAGYEVIAVNNGSAALKKIAELKPDLVILDVYMPGYSGLEVCQRLKESPETARIPVLLTVGKLEPFKPQEAQRVGAEAFIVKPFEASELLSALSKLEDKVVPRAEPSKPGRFARAIAAVEETSRGSRKETATEPDSWPSRIARPREKTGIEEKAADDSAIYNNMNRDLRTVVETPAEKAAEKVEEEKQSASGKIGEATLDVAALAQAGLPKDVTPEEVAAIAAAVAQVQIAGAVADEHPVDEGRSSETEAFESRILETATQSSQPPSDRVEGKFAAVVPEEAVREEAKTEALQENKINAVAEEVKSEEPQDLPVTMAAATAESVASMSVASRWAAVPVELAGEEAAISLEQEMQKAYAYLVSAEAESAVVAAAQEVTAPQGENSFSPEVAPLEAHAEIAPTAEVAEGNAAPVAMSASVSEPVTSVVDAVVSDPASPSAQDVVAQDAVASESIASASVAPEVQELQPAPVTESAIAEPATSNDAAPIAGGDDHAAEHKPESETVKSTAAAWASWRQMRDTHKDTEAAQNESPSTEFVVSEPAPAETAAMAVAAGAEQILQEVKAAPNGDRPDVASIVDSVLADLRPKLMEEISRKMAEKK
jgi:CheY-like chemotaxis protein